jgi:hypothetical protein
MTDFVPQLLKGVVLHVHTMIRLSSKTHGQNISVFLSAMYTFKNCSSKVSREPGGVSLFSFWTFWT